ncbi:MAG: hypothetical protein U0031_17180 [Thermomicrobiales bacterium]
MTQPAAPPDSSLSRRRLLRAATGAFVLSASGLYLPATVEEADARSGALDGRLGGRHGRDRRGQDRRRTHGDKKDNRKNDAPRGSGQDGTPFGVRIYVLNYRTTAIQVQGWVAPFDDIRVWSQPDTSWTWSTVGALPNNGDPQYKVYRTDLANLAVQIGTDRVIYVEGSNTPDPRWTAVLAGLWDATGWDTNPQTLKLQDLKPSESLEVEGFRLQRLENSYPIASNPEYEFYLYVI